MIAQFFSVFFALYNTVDLIWVSVLLVILNAFGHIGGFVIAAVVVVEVVVPVLVVWAVVTIAGSGIFICIIF